MRWSWISSIPTPGPGPPGGGRGPAGPPGGPTGGAYNGGYSPVERLDFTAQLLTLMELGTISVVRVSMAQPMEVASIIRPFVSALASPTLLQAIQQVSDMPVILERVPASVTVLTVPIGKEMAVFFLGDDGRESVVLESPFPPFVPYVGCGMRACDVCCPFPARLCESCRITSCTPIGALISTVADKDRYHHKCNTITLPPE